ncbi:hypothetical protein Lal_00044736 [Lupinus albus]|nr:hypothetical protein Lal_00044736 [Lupinus albus]
MKFWKILSLVKIIKKYDKQTGALIRLPFFKIDVLNKLVEECEVMPSSEAPTLVRFSSSDQDLPKSQKPPSFQSTESNPGIAIGLFICSRANSK